MSWLKDKVDNMTENKDSALNKILDGRGLGTVAEMGIDTQSLVKLGLVIVVGGITILLFYKFVIQKNN